MMSRAEILKIVNEIFRTVFEDNSLIITEKTYSADIEDWDSLAQITLVTTVEDSFEIQFLMEDVMKMKNVGDMLDVIERELNVK